MLQSGRPHPSLKILGLDGNGLNDRLPNYGKKFCLVVSVLLNIQCTKIIAIIISILAAYTSATELELSVSGPWVTLRGKSPALEVYFSISVMDIIR
jgi:hypothetical protein